MDNNHYSSNVINTTTASYPSPSAISPHHLQNGQNQTLPPLQPHNPAMSMYASHQHNSRTPGTPNTPASMGGYAPPPSQPSGRGQYPMMHNPYQHPQQTYTTSSAMMPQTSVAATHPQPIAPAPSPVGRVPPVLRPMPAGGVMPQSGLASPYAQSPMMGQPSILQESDQPTHVVGSQGRRGILPSAPGRPAAPAPGSAAAKAQVPQKDADGKFPCPHCTKTYLHAKHLKRHMLRHTGDRPYMCVLCRDTFSRSDILKRHFQKCSIRRGNPQNMSHLSHPSAHVKKAQAAAQKAASLGHEGDMHLNGMNNVPGQNPMVPFGLIPAPDQMNHLSNPNDQAQLSRSSSMNRLEDNNSEERRSVPTPVMGGSSQQQYNGNVPTSMATNINPQLANYNMQPNQNGVAMYNGSNNQQSGLDWSQMFGQQQGGAQHNTYAKSYFLPPNDGQTQTAIKTEPNFDPPRQDGPPASNPTDTRFLFSTLGSPTDTLTYQQLSNQITSFFYPPDVILSHQRTNKYFSAEDVQHFLEKYAHFQIHFAVLHTPTFDVEKAYIGLLACMCCIGACYSERVSASHVREMTDFLKAALDRDSSMLALLNDSTHFRVVRHDRKDLEKLQALVLLQVLLTWNGTVQQRQASLQVYANIATIARKASLLRVSEEASLFSPLHQPSFNPSTHDPPTFDWRSWINQEERVRVMHLIYLLDVALGLYFNNAPNFEASEIQIPLPCDDAAWDAADATSCAEALGLRGPEAAKWRNPDGTQRAKQPELHLALSALLHSSYQIQTGTTNLHGKFILIHALLAFIRRAQVEGSSVLNNGQLLSFAQNDWIVNTRQDGSSAPASASNSGRNSPAEGHIPPQTLRAIRTALDKFKQSWDSDFVNQFPPSSRSPRRKGFSKDAIPFYWLAAYLLRNTRPSDLETHPEQRLVQVINLLKSVKAWVLGDGASRGEEMGSVGEIDKDFGVTDFTLDMAKLFRPLPGVVEPTGITTVKKLTENSSAATEAGYKTEVV